MVFDLIICNHEGKPNEKNVLVYLVKMSQHKVFVGYNVIRVVSLYILFC